MKSDHDHAVVVFAMTATGLAVARSLAPRGIATYGVDSKRWEVGHHSAHVKRSEFAYLEHGDRLATAVCKWASGQEAPPVLFPADDPSCEFLTEYYEELSRSCLLSPGYGTEAPTLMLNKSDFYRHCRRLGLDLPRTVFPNDVAELEAQSGDLQFPVILKPAHGHLWRKRFHGKKVLEVNSRDELKRTFEGLGDLKTGMTVQEVIPGPEREIFVCGAYTTEDGEAHTIFTARKTRQYPPRFGSGSLLCSETNETIAKLSMEDRESVV